MARKSLKQIWLASVLGISQSGASNRLKGIVPFTVAELLLVAANLDLSLAELLGSELVNAKHPRPEAVEGDLWAPSGSNRRPAD